MRQTRWQSFVEVNVGTAIGFAVSWAATPAILFAFGYSAGPGKALGITLVYTALSLVRGWVVRRGFDWWHARGRA